MDSGGPNRQNFGQERMDHINNPSLLSQVFFSYALQKQAAILNENRRFVHYTSAEAAVSIIKNAEVWMRKSTTMNDFSETAHGLRCLQGMYTGPAGKRFKSLLERLFSGSVEVLEKNFEAWLPHFRLNTYLTCISEHENEEDSYGRLSMWRAYGGVAIVLNNYPFLAESHSLGAYTSPVAYLDPQRFADKFEEINDLLEQHEYDIQSQTKDVVLNNVFEMMRFAVLCTKHPGFQEEREWRIVYSPVKSVAERITKSIEIVRGIPQPVCKIPLKNIPEEGFIGAEISQLVNRLIIGPNQYPGVMQEAFVELLTNAGVPHDDAWRMVCISESPSEKFMNSDKAF